MASRIASLSEERWTNKFFDWHPGHHNKIKTRRLVGRPKRRLEDDINEFTKPGETKEGNKYDFMNNNNWMTEAKKKQKMKRKRRKIFKKKRQQISRIDVQNDGSECFVLAHPIQFQVPELLFVNFDGLDVQRDI